MKNITLIGMPGVGKSTIGVVLAKVLGKQFIDADLVIQEQNKNLLCDLIEMHGIDGFLELESSAICSLKPQDAIIATGGSAIYKEKTMQHIKEIGKVVYLQLSYKELEKRLNNVKGRGVVLKDGQSLFDLYQERVPLYEKYADIVICEEGLDIEGTVTEITRFVDGS